MFAGKCYWHCGVLISSKDPFSPRVCDEALEVYSEDQLSSLTSAHANTAPLETTLHGYSKTG